MHRNRFLQYLFILVLVGLTGGCGNASGYVTTGAVLAVSPQPVTVAAASQVKLFPDDARTQPWLSLTDPNEVRLVALDPRGSIWTAGPGGVARWDLQANTSQVFTTSDGLPSNDITALAVAPDGKVWIGTTAGYLALYEGRSWSILDPLPGESINSLAVSPDGSLWIGTNLGLRRLGGSGGDLHSPAGLGPDRQVQSVASTSKGVIWAGVIGGVLSYDGSWHAKDLEKGQVISAIAPAPDGTVWFGSADLLYHFDGRLWTALPLPAGLGSIASLAAGSQGTLWLVDGAGRLAGFDTGKSAFLIYKSVDATTLALDPSGSLGLGLRQGGLARFDGKTLHPYLTQDGLSANSIRAAASAPDGGLWFATDQGAARFDGQTWQYFTSADGLAADSVLSIAPAPDGSTWFGTENGVSHYIAGNWQTFGAASGLLDPRIFQVAVGPDGNVWAASLRSIYRWQDGQWLMLGPASADASDRIQGITAGVSGGLWTLTTRGIWFFDGQAWTSLELPNQARALHLIQTANRDLWIQSGGSVLFFIDGKLWDHLSGGNVPLIVLDEDGRVHLNNGFSDVPLDGRFWQVYTGSDGLPGSIEGIAPRLDGGIWVYSSEGIFGLTGQHWTRAFGPPGRAPLPLSFLLQDAQGHLWSGTPLNGLIEFLP